MRFGPLIKCFQRNDFIDRHKTLLCMSCHQVREDEGARLRPESIPIMLASFFALSLSLFLAASLLFIATEDAEFQVQASLCLAFGNFEKLFKSGKYSCWFSGLGCSLLNCRFFKKGTFLFFQKKIKEMSWTETISELGFKEEDSVLKWVGLSLLWATGYYLVHTTTSRLVTWTASTRHLQL